MIYSNIYENWVDKTVHIYVLRRKNQAELIKYCTLYSANNLLIYVLPSIL